MNPRARSRWPVPTGLVLGSCVVFLIASLAHAGGRSAAGSWHPKTGLAFREPPRIVSSGGVLSATLTARQESVSVSGDDVTARVYNGSFTGPTLVVKAGDAVRLELVNRLDEPTNLHFHGVHVSPSGSADNVFVMVQPGKSHLYSFRIPADHPSGLYWYHSHMHHDAEEQVFGGLSGMLVIDGITDLLPKRLRGIREREFALRDLQVTDDGSVATTQALFVESTRVLNSLLKPNLTIRPGATQLWRFANIGANTFYRLAFGGRAFHVVAEDGRPVWKVWGTKRLDMPPGKRFEVLVQGPPKGTYQLKTLEFDAGPTAGRFSSAVLATVTSDGTAVEPAELPTTFGPNEELTDEDIAKSYDVTFRARTVPPTFMLRTCIHGTDTCKEGPYSASRIDARATLGTVQEWHLDNATGDWHPFHMHTDYFQVMSVNGTKYPSRGLQDTVLVPPHSTDVTIRIEFEDFAGETVYHCHILNHEDHGMMANIVISR